MRTFWTCLTLTLVGTAALAQNLPQQAPPPSQGWSQNDPAQNGQSQNDPYNRQYAPNQQSDQQPSDARQPNATSDVEPQQGYSQAQPLSPEQLDQLVAPIALYPDTLVAQVLAASTYPNQVVDADRWRQAQAYASPDQIVAGADAQNWDPSLKGLTAFPQVLTQMARNIQWTTDLGNAYYNQPQDVLEAVQVMRQRAQAAGNLQSTPQETVTYDQGNIELAPPDPETVYVPSYNPWNVYGQPVSPYPGFSLLGALGSFFGSSPIRYGLGIAMGAFTHTPWGLLGWGLDWLAHSVLFNNSDYFSQSNTVADWGFPHGGRRAFSGRGFSQRGFSQRAFSERSSDHSFSNHSFSNRGATARPPYGSNRTQGSFDRSGGRYDANRGQGFTRPPDRFAGDRFAGNRPAGDRFAGDRSSTERSATERFAGTRPPERSSRGYETGNGYSRSQLQANNRMQSPAMPQQYNRSSYGEGFSSARGAPYGSRPGALSGSPQRTYRAPAPAFQRSDFGKGASKSARSGGFHLFGGGHSSGNFSSMGHAPKMKASKGFGGGHFGGGGHSGGGHFGGGGHSGGGHFGGGGHSSSHHSGGHHH